MKQEAQICLQCVGDEELRNLLSESATCMECSFCEEHRLAVPLKTLADHIDEVYREHFKPGSWSYFGQEGSTPQDIIEGIALLESEVAAAVIDILAVQEARDVRDGADPYYEHGCNYVQNDYVPYEQEWSWNEFYHRIKHRRRYFDEAARSSSLTIFD